MRRLAIIALSIPCIALGIFFDLLKLPIVVMVFPFLFCIQTTLHLRHQEGFRNLWEFLLLFMAMGTNMSMECMGFHGWKGLV